MRSTKHLLLVSVQHLVFSEKTFSSEAFLMAVLKMKEPTGEPDHKI